MKVARTPLEGARAEEARWAGLLPGEEPGRGRRRQVEEVEGEEAAEAMRARGEEAAAGPDVAVAPAVRPSRPLGTAAQRRRAPAARAASPIFVWPVPPCVVFLFPVSPPFSYIFVWPDSLFFNGTKESLM